MVKLLGVVSVSLAIGIEFSDGSLGNLVLSGCMFLGGSSKVPIVNGLGFRVYREPLLAKVTLSDMRTPQTPSITQHSSRLLRCQTRKPTPIMIAQIIITIMIINVYYCNDDYCYSHHY